MERRTPRPAPAAAGRAGARAAAVALLTGTAEGALVVGLLAGRLPGWAAAAGHALVVAALLARVLRQVRRDEDDRRDEDCRSGWLLLGATATLGPIGALGTLMTLALQPVFARHVMPLDDRYRLLFPDTRKDPARVLYESLTCGGRGAPDTSTAAPFDDIIRLGTVDQKLTAVALISDHFHPSFAPALRRALNDSEAAIRVQAATVMARIESRFLERSIALEAAARATPDDPDAALPVARALLDHAATGLLDPRRAAEQREQALVLFRRCRARRPQDTGLALATAAVLLDTGRFAEAVTLLSTLTQGSAPAVVLLARALYGLGRFAEVRSLIATQTEHGSLRTGGLSEEERQALALWSLSAERGLDVRPKEAAP